MTLIGIRKEKFVVRIGNVELTREEIEDIDRRLDEFILSQKPFLKHGYSLQQLSAGIDISLHHLSAFINQYYEMNFNNLINWYRINYCIETVKSDEWRNSKIEAIAKNYGFNNRNSFSAAFQKVTGMSPSKYFAKHYKT